VSADLRVVPGLPEDSTPGVRIEDVIVGERARKDYGDLTDLIESIRQHGLLQPIGVLPGNRLLFGGRRLEACRQLGWESIPYTRPHTQDHALALLKAERDENTCRKDMTLSELVELGRRIEEMERPAAQARITEGAKRGAEVRWDSDAPRADARRAYGNETRRKVGDALGVSGATFERAKHILDLANDPTAPEEVRAVARDAAAEMDQTGKAWAPFQKVKEAEKTHPPAPKGGVNKSRAAVAARIEQARDLASTGRTSGQIAAAIGMSEASAKEMFRREGIDIPADRVVGRAHRLNANRVVEQTVRAAEPSPELLAAINYGDLDRALLGEWISSLSESLKALRSLKTTLEKELSRVSA
jgi:ParB-like chromosome segregation protein Spo0J